VTGRALGALAAMLCAGVALAQSPGVTDTPEQGEVRLNPHFAVDRCVSCHAEASPGATSEVIPWAAGTANDTCRSCHDSAPHEVDIDAHRRGATAPDVPRDLARVPPGFPLPDGQLACLTCHDEPACSGGGQDPANPRFFRGGPYASLGDLCENCHGAAEEVRFNPHLAMEEKRDTTAICEFCHDLVDGEPDLERLKVDRVQICYGCHEDTRHTGSAEHLQILDDDMRARADAGGLPLTPEGQVFCGTCHDPHPPGSKRTAMDRAEWAGTPLFDDPWLWSVMEPILQGRAATLDTDPMPWTFEPDYMRKPLRGNALCGTCHTPDDTEKRRRRK